jgi:hypothetical protein
VQSLILKLGVSMLTKLLTERFLAQATCRLLSAWAKSTDNTTDDGIVNAMAEAWGVPAAVIKDVVANQKKAS